MFEKSALNRIFGFQDRVDAGSYFRAFGRMSIPKPEAKKLTGQFIRQGLVEKEFRGRGGMFYRKTFK